MQAWLPLLQTLIGALIGGLLATGIIAHLTQKWIEQRERRRKRDQLRLELYLDIVDLVLDNELAIAERGQEGQIPPIELQRSRLRASHRLKLLGSPTVKNAYKKYSRLVFQETAHPIQYRPSDPDEVVHARDTLIAAMANDVQEERGTMTDKASNSIERISELDWFSFFLHQDNMQWSRLQTLGTVQVAALGGAYLVREDRLVAIAAILIGFVLSVLVFLLFKRDEQYRLKVEEKLEALNITVPRKWYAPLTGREIAWLVFGILFLADLCLGTLIVFA